ncbi:MAG: transcription antitermination factor NusB [Sphaerochaetaceae bacterium]|nr:transcription antitermination factor NusB [Sphaerochaetaceae bacterium]
MARELALTTLYSLDFHKVIYENPEFEEFPTLTDEEREALNPETVIFAKYLLAGTLEHLKEIDSMITKYSINRPLDKIDIIDRNILRMSIFSLLYDKDIPSHVVITEGVRLSQEYSREVNYKFINGILDSMEKQLR